MAGRIFYQHDRLPIGTNLIDARGSIARAIKISRSVEGQSVRNFPKRLYKNLAQPGRSVGQDPIARDSGQETFHDIQVLFLVVERESVREG